ncbi:MAG: GntR family transcriptional regulator [Gemmatales bacterium]|nr:MAG: GntR family transcriptional regulator [Gemmatales bacterium]
MKMRPVRRQSLVDSVIEQIQNVITEGDYGPGDRLPTEADLVKQLDVSRTVLREAIGRLRAMGLVTTRGPRGMFVGDTSSLRNCAQLIRSAMAISPQELTQFTEFRRGLECEAVRLAAERATPEDIAELEDLCEQVRNRNSSAEEVFDVDLRFHQKLLSIAGNELIANVMAVVQEFMMASIVEGGRGRRHPKTYPQHHAIVEAIRKRDPDAAEHAMREHLDEVLRVINRPRK